MSKKKFPGDYYVGLDVGTSSVGWAVSDPEYRIPNFNGKAMWGSVLFSEAQTAAERRIHRCARRRTMRRKYRLQLLQSLFAEAIAPIDPGYFMRLKVSNLWEDDKREKGVEGKYSFFNDPNYTDKDFYKQYPTIYHLRHELATSREPHDVRLVYLALHHIIKHRGHFLMPGEFTSTKDILLDPLVDDLRIKLEEYLGVEIGRPDMEMLKSTLASSEGVKAKTTAFKKCFSYDKEDKAVVEAVISLLAGGKTKLAKLFNDESLNEGEKKDITFGGAFAEEEDIYRSLLDDRFEVIEKVKIVYDWGVLQHLLAGKESLSAAKVDVYETHKRGLQELKRAVRTLCPQEYKRLFGQPQGKEANYSRYVGGVGTKHLEVSLDSCSAEDFYKFALGLFKDQAALETQFPSVYHGLKEGNLLPKQKIKDNGVLPHQIHKVELQAILENASTYLPFLQERDNNGMTVADKIVSLLTFRIPYYVGPLNTFHEKYAWVAKKADATGPITPWNFDEHIDQEESAKRFIRRMTNKCTYLPTEDVLPKSSLLYSKFMVLNELNNLGIHDKKIPVETKQLIFEQLFLQRKKVTRKAVLTFLVQEGILPKGTDVSALTGIDIEFINTMGVYSDFAKAFGVTVLDAEQEQLAEQIILESTLFGDDAVLKRKRIERVVAGKYPESFIKAVCAIKCNGWGRLSEKFLTGLPGTIPDVAEPMTILEAMYTLPNNPNLMQLLSNDYPYSRMAESYGLAELENLSLEDRLDRMYLSPSVKRSIYQTLGVMDELVSILGKAPKRIFIEMARAEEEKKRTKSRKVQLLELYKACDKLTKDEEKILGNLENEPDSKLLSKKFYLYYLQMGKCAYSGEVIPLEQLGNYDIEHIYPRSAVKDDSFSNLVLVKRELNALKGDEYPVPASFRNNSKVQALWRSLLAAKMMDRKKYDRLTRNTPFTDGELEGFISRQLVETRQSTKALAHLLEQKYPDSTIVYVKAHNVSEFRQGVLDMPKPKGWTKEEKQAYEKGNAFIKCREINNFHHAKDAYLNIVVGNVYYTKFTSNPKNFIKNRRKKGAETTGADNTKQRGYSLNGIYCFPVERWGITAWIPSTLDLETGALEMGTMATVRKYMRRNNVVVVRRPFEQRGALFDVNLMKKGKGQVSQKGMGPLKDINKYGGYNKAKGAYFFLVEHGPANKRVTSIEAVYLKDVANIHSTEDLVQLCRESYQLVDPEVLLPKIRYDELLEIDGVRMRLSSRENAQSLSMNNAYECVVEEVWYAYIKNIYKMIERSKYLGERVVESNLGISEEMNKLLYQYLINKMKEKPYKSFLDTNSRCGKIELAVNQFSELSVLLQVKVLVEILKLFNTGKARSNLELIGEAKTFGRMQMSKNLGKIKEVFIVYQSKTGLFENKKRLGRV